jgi:hypothetical protein
MDRDRFFRAGTGHQLTPKPRANGRIAYSGAKIFVAIANVAWRRNF